MATNKEEIVSEDKVTRYHDPRHGLGPGTIEKRHYSRRKISKAQEISTTGTSGEEIPSR